MLSASPTNHHTIVQTLVAIFFSLSLSTRSATLIAERFRRKKMPIDCKVSIGIFAPFALVFAIFTPAVQGQGYKVMAPAPAPTNDGTAIDQGIAYGLMVLALVLTYLIHSFDAPLGI